MSVGVGGCVVVIVRNTKRHLTRCLNKTAEHRNIISTREHTRDSEHTPTNKNNDEKQIQIYTKSSASTKTHGFTTTRAKAGMLV